MLGNAKKRYLNTKQQSVNWTSAHFARQKKVNLWFDDRAEKLRKLRENEIINGEEEEGDDDDDEDRNEKIPWIVELNWIKWNVEVCEHEREKMKQQQN